MIAARKSALFNFGLRRLLWRTLRRRFHNIYLAGREHLDELAPGHPVVGCVNHSNWWDGFVLYVLSHRLLPHEIYLAMEEKNLRQYRFFTWMGVFGLDLTSPRRVLSGMRYAIRLLRQKAAHGRPPMIWMFVQGRLLPAGTPIEVKPGALLLARQTVAQLLPLTLRYEWLRESRPSIFIDIGHPLAPDTSPERLAETLNELFARFSAAAPPGSPNDYQPLYAPQMSMNKWWDYLRHRLRRSGDPFESNNR